MWERAAKGKMRTTARKCYVCEEVNNPIVIVEQPIEERFGVPVLPASAYELAGCRRCGALYVDCDVTDEYLAALYRNESVVWQKAFLEKIGFVGDAISGSRLPEFEAHWRDLKQVRAPVAGDELLDLGCQTGEFGSVAQADGVMPYGIELSTDYADQAGRNWGGADRVSSAPLSPQTFPGRRFAYVTAFETLEHMPDPRACLRQLRDRMTSDGVFALSVPSTHYFWLKFKVLHAIRRNPGLFKFLLGSKATMYSRQILPHTHLFNFSARAVRLLLEQSGFRVECVRAVGWTGRSSALDTLCHLTMRLTGERYGMAPSLFAIARPE